MDRRSFLSTLVGGIAVGAAQRTFPFRVFSFPAPKPKVWSFKNTNGILSLSGTSLVGADGQFVVEYTDADLEAFRKQICGTYQIPMDRLFGLNGIARKPGETDA